MNFSAKEKFSFIFIAALIVLAAGMRIYYFFQAPQVKTEKIQVVKVLEKSASTTPVVSNQEIVIDQPQPGTQISAPFAVAGKARGNWFFEGSFPLKIVDEQAKVLAIGQAQAQLDWMTESFVPFVGVLELAPGETVSSGTKAFLVLSKDNPSGLPEHDASTSIPIIIN
ncbi:MAG: hypothetical protein NT165_03140 [Candidatus Falkowbacteria bacterium]|nr:hypothetical protein [Candidatus Falkowbacteria bacterium]